MTLTHGHALLAALALGAAAAGAHAAPPSAYPFTWTTVVNNGDFMPTDTCDPSNPVVPPCRMFNSYNQPSVNARQVVVIRARSRGGQDGQRNVHGVYSRDMGAGGPVVKLLDRDTAVPQPNNRNATFIEPPSFPRIDVWSDTKATRGNHEPVWQGTGNGEAEPLGTSGVYTDPFGPLITGASKLGSVPDFSFFEVPEAPGTAFEVFPGAPSVTDRATIVFKGNYTAGTQSRTGVYYRDLGDAPIPVGSTSALLAPAGGTQPVVLIANSADTLIPGSDTVFGSTAPPSAANREAVFAGFDNEENPTLGGIYLAPLAGTLPPLKPLVEIGSRVPGESGAARFNRLGEALSFDGRFVAFWGAWGSEVKTLNLVCPAEGNALRRAFCQALCRDHPEQCTRTVPVSQGIFVHDAYTGRTHAVAKTPRDFSDFVFWNFSAVSRALKEGDDGEPARWRSTAFVAVSGLVDGTLGDAVFHAAFKARTGAVVAGIYVEPVDGIYLRRGPGRAPLLTVVQTGMDATLLDREALDELGNSLPVTEMGVERDGFRGSSLVINVRMGSEETGWAGIYLTNVPAR